MKKTLKRIIILTLALLYFYAGFWASVEAAGQFLTTADGTHENPTSPAAFKSAASNAGYKSSLPAFKSAAQDMDIKCRRIGPITREECFVDEEGSPVRGFTIEDPQPGDIFVTASTHSLGWRHGHVALVVGTEPLTTIEAVVLGQKSRIIENPMWERYPTFAHLRLKDEYGGAELAAETAEFALKELTNCSYGFFCDKDCVDSSGSADEDEEKYHCAHLVWRAYKEIGLDIDSDGGKVVTPFDIYNSSYFESAHYG
ncbi:MAG: hypothetical protein E7228_07620 [Clostridiales bacterium]|nr:hypothetical protein [Clostridiales bacterium]